LHDSVSILVFMLNNIFLKGGADENLDLNWSGGSPSVFYEDRIRAVELYIKYDLSATDTVKEFGYPSNKMLVRWFRKYQETGRLHESYIKNRLYTQHQMGVAAVNYYLE